MKHALWGIVLLALISSSANAKKPTEIPERWSFRFDDREWHLGYQAGNRQEAIREYVLVGQTVENWKELVTSHYFAHDVPLSSYFEQVKAGLARGCESLSISVLEESENTMLYEWRHDGCQGYPPQHQLERATRTGKETLVLSFVEKTPQLSPEKRSAWLTILKDASIPPADSSGAGVVRSAPLAETGIPKQRLRDGVYTSPGGEFTVNVPKWLIEPGVRAEERQTGPAAWGVFFADDLGKLFFVLWSDNTAANMTLEQITADIEVGERVRSKETVESARGPEIRVAGVEKNGSPLRGSTERDGKPTELPLDLVKASSLFLRGKLFYEVSVGVTRLHDDQTDAMLLERAKKELEESLSGLILTNP
jgi:hypothetical protein